MEQIELNEEREINKILSRIEIEKLAPWRQEEWAVMSYDEKLFALEKYSKLQNAFYKIYERPEYEED